MREGFLVGDLTSKERNDGEVFVGCLFAFG